MCIPYSKDPIIRTAQHSMHIYYTDTKYKYFFLRDNFEFKTSHLRVKCFNLQRKNSHLYWFEETHTLLFLFSFPLSLHTFLSLLFPPSHLFPPFLHRYISLFLSLSYIPEVVTISVNCIHGVQPIYFIGYDEQTLFPHSQLNMQKYHTSRKPISIKLPKQQNNYS